MLHEGRGVILYDQSVDRLFRLWISRLISAEITSTILVDRCSVVASCNSSNASDEDPWNGQNGSYECCRREGRCAGQHETRPQLSVLRVYFDSCEMADHLADHLLAVGAGPIIDLVGLYPALDPFDDVVFREGGWDVFHVGDGGVFTVIIVRVDHVWRVV